MPHKTVIDREGNELPSVTQIIGILAKPELYRWYGKHGFEKCEAIKKDAAEWGTELHSSISQWIKGKEVEVSDRCVPMFEAFKQWYKKSGFKAIIVEPDNPLQSAYGYQGTFDALGELDGEIIMADWKTSAAIYPENGLQLAAYAQLCKEAGWESNKYLKPIRNGLIVRIDKKTFKVQTRMFYYLPAYFDIFKSLIPVYNFVKKRGLWVDL